MMRFAIALILTASCAAAQEADVFDGAQVVFLGETHDNPAHHARQAEIVKDLQPASIVFEMLTEELAAKVTTELIAQRERLGEELEWEARGWPDFDMYAPIFEAAPSAAYYGAALPREEAQRAQGEPLGKVFGLSAGFYGLDEPLPPEQQAEREQMQADAHCGALPPEMVPAMVGIQRLRDARLAETALQAFADHGGPVVVITGNGHARMDWGAPALLHMAAPEVKVAALGQGEGGSDPSGMFAAVEDAPAVERDDPCAAFADREMPGHGAGDDAGDTPGN